MILRDYQRKMLDDTRTALGSHRSVIIQSECGSGKGTVCAVMIHRAVERGFNVLFLVRGKDRCLDMDNRVTGMGVEHGILLGGKRRERHHPVQIASIDTVHRMQYKPLADMILIDEAHLGQSATFREVLDFYPEAKIIGMSATPELGNGKPLGVKSGGIFEHMVHGPSVTRLIAEKHLVGSRVFAPPPPPDLKGLKKKKTGDFDEEQGASICDDRKIIGDIIENWKTYSSDRKAAVFGFNKKHAHHIAEQFREQGINWACVTADTPDGDIHTPGTRKFYWHQMEFGDLVGVSAVDTISLGWDMPPCKAVILACKTASFPRYRQRIGRGSRPYKGYEFFHVHDHTANHEEHQDKGPWFESEIKWQLDGDGGVKKHDEDDPAPRVSTCKRPQPIPDAGVPSWFKGQTTNGYMLCCYLTFKAGPTECPRCGLPVVIEQPDIKVEEGQLQEITAEARELSAKQIERESKLRARYLELIQIGLSGRKKDGTPWSPKWATIAFKHEYGFWPKKNWAG